MKKALLIVCAVAVSSFYASAQQASALGADQLSSQTSSVKGLKSVEWAPRYKGEVNVGYVIAGKKFDFDWSYSDNEGENDYEYGGKYQTVFSRPLIETVHGVEIGPYIFVGAGVGLQYYCGKMKDLQMLAETAAEVNGTKEASRWNAIMLPIFADVKLTYPFKNGLTPFINLGLGGTVGCHSSANCEYSEGTFDIAIKTKGGFYCDFGAGLRYKNLNFSVGLQHQALALKMEETEYYNGEVFSCEDKYSTNINAFYVKVGVNF